MRSRITGNRAVVALALAASLTVVLYEVRLNVEIAFATEVQQPDPVTEAAYTACYAQKDEEMHRLAFATIDNPDVQKEFISAQRASIAHRCRQEFPLKMITLQQDAQFNLVDLQARYW